jgi:ppGpp synthetase/RelA/SpoT-type nucleotidyltranferase
MDTDKTMFLDAHNNELMEQFGRLQPTLQKLRRSVLERLEQALARQDIEIAGIESRIKTEKSLAGKLELKGTKYRTITDITDLVGMRVITFYTDDVDKVAAIAQHSFSIDWDKSVDKRQLLKTNSFGYNSLHYICRITDDEELASVAFELQIRTALQHAWSSIEHDIGYKNVVKLPEELRRQFGRLAGTLELVDDEFSRLRTVMTDYRRKMQALVESGRLEEVALTADNFRSYLQELHPFDRLNQRIAAVNQAEVMPVSLMPYLRVLEKLFGFQTLGDVEAFKTDNSKDAYRLALSQLAMTDLDILASSVGLQNLCLVHVLKTGGGREGILQFYDIVNGPQESNALLADAIMEQAELMSL